MEKQDFLETGEMNNLPIESSIHREDTLDDYDLFLLAQLDNITNQLAADTYDIPMLHNLDLTSHETENSNNILPEPEQILDENITLNNVQELTSHIPEASSNCVQDAINNGNMIQKHIDESSNLYQVWYKIENGKHVKSWMCNVCQKVFIHHYTLMRHLTTHKDERKYQCITCGKAFNQMSTLCQHRAVHSTERPYICEICKKTFNRVSTLISHRKTHTGLKPHACHLCTKAFHQKGNLRNHIFTHTNARPHKCDICEKGFNQMSNLMCHKIKAHQITEKPKYICQVCNKRYAKHILLKLHEQYCHKMISTSILSTEDKQHLDNLTNTNAIFVEPINTEAMRLAIESNVIPFALFCPENGVPVLVTVVPAGEKQMLLPASVEDLKSLCSLSNNCKNDKTSVERKLQVKIPIVATVVQQNDFGGKLSISVVNPGPNQLFGNHSEIISFKVDNFANGSTFTNYDENNFSDSKRSFA
ncbi:zinc finger protein 664-like isoform X2 [Diorhabda carinulata]|uniref:zinc finger protein 664-like isoform X2 n=1 Tax=Diorhabda carinulata TaxID=1163345 RepID=UPI0025A18736|nr:zinc finger protein 664-like isoform X2 [Diorhabda carinulata]